MSCTLWWQSTLVVSCIWCPAVVQYFSALDQWKQPTSSYLLRSSSIPGVGYWNCPHHISPVFTFFKKLSIKVDCIQEFEYFKILKFFPPLSPFGIGNWSRFTYSLQELFGAAAMLLDLTLPQHGKLLFRVWIDFTSHWL